VNITEAASKGIARVCKPEWKAGYVRIYIHDGFAGPWITAWDRPVQKVSGLDCPQVLLSIQANDEDFVEYTGEVDPADVEGWPKIEYAYARQASA
jgi:hypothetical protein